MTNIHRFIALTTLCSSLLVACGGQQPPVEKAAESAQAHAEAAASEAKNAAAEAVAAAKAAGTAAELKAAETAEAAKAAVDQP